MHAAAVGGSAQLTANAEEGTRAAAATITITKKRVSHELLLTERPNRVSLLFIGTPLFATVVVRRLGVH